jgi:hypothetical protein
MEQLNTAREDARQIASAAGEASSQRQVAASLQRAMDTQAQAPQGGRR